MNLIKIKNIYAALSEAVPDPAVGISLAHVAGDETFSFYVTKLPPQCQLTAHFHQKGEELYNVVQGTGLIWLACAENDGSYREKTHQKMAAGDTFMVPELTVHQLVNPGPDSIIMLFGCPQSHITSDRHLVDDLKTEI